MTRNFTLKHLLPALLVASALLLAAPAVWAGADADPQLDAEPAIENAAPMAELGFEAFTFPAEPLSGFALASGQYYACFAPDTPGVCTSGCPSGQSCGIQVYPGGPYPWCIASGPQCVPRCDINVNQARFCPVGGGGFLTTEKTASLDGCSPLENR